MIRLDASLICIFILLAVSGCGGQPNGDSDVNVGIGLQEQRKFAEAIPHLEKGLTKSLRFYTRCEVLTTIGNCYNDLEQFEKSLEYHDRAIKEDPTNHQAYVNMGVVYRLTGEYEKAAQAYSKALELAPDYAELHASMGALAMYQEDFEGAVSHLERSIQLDDTLAVAHSNLAVAYATVGRFDEADNQLKQAIMRGYHQPELIRERIEQLRSSSSTEK